MKTKLIAPLVFFFLVLIGAGVASGLEIIDLIGDKDQSTPPNPDGVGIIHEVDDPPGFDMRQVGTTVSWVHDVSSEIMGFPMSSARLYIAVVGLIDGNYSSNGNVMDNRLFVDGHEIIGAFDGSHDGWRLYYFDIDIQWLTDGILNISLVSDTDPLEGWGGPDYSELHIFGKSASVPEPSTFLLLGAGLAGIGIMRRKMRR